MILKNNISKQAELENILVLIAYFTDQARKLAEKEPEFGGFGEDIDF